MGIVGRQTWIESQICTLLCELIFLLCEVGIIMPTTSSQLTLQTIKQGCICKRVWHTAGPGACECEVAHSRAAWYTADAILLAAVGAISQKEQMEKGQSLALRLSRGKRSLVPRPGWPSVKLVTHLGP